MTSPEEWRPVLGYEGLYEVSSKGRVRSLDRRVPSRWGKTRNIRGVVLKPYLDRDGYPVCTLSRSQHRVKKRVSRIVAESFLERVEGADWVLHKDDVKTNNVSSNLYWGTPKQNTQDSIHNGTHGRMKRTHCRRGHEYTVANTRRRADRPRSRICIECERGYK